MGAGLEEAEVGCFFFKLRSAMESFVMKGEERREEWSEVAETGEEMWGEGAKEEVLGRLSSRTAWAFESLGVSSELDRIEVAAGKPIRGGGVAREP